MADNFMNGTGLAALRDWIRSKVNARMYFSSTGRKATFTNSFKSGEQVDIQNIDANRTSIYILANGLATTNYIPTEAAMNAAIANARINFEVGVERPYGTYTDEDGVLYQSYSKIIYIPALPSTAGITNYPHGISGIKQILQVYGFTTDGFVLNAPRQNTQDNIAIYQAQKAGNIAIEVGKDRSSKKAYVTLIYAKNN